MNHSFLHNKTILLVDDAPELLKMVTAILADEGFHNIVSVEEAVNTTKKENPDLAVLDVMLPDGDGFSLLRQLREFTDIPVIFLTAKDEAPDKLAGLGLGADDYIVKPFLPQEFLLRLYAVLRRCHKEDTPLVRLECCTIDFSRAEVCRDGKVISLTAKEHTLLETLGSGEPVSLSVHGELSVVADSVQRAAHLLNSQNQARANWISGVSHDIRTPLSMVMGYAERIAHHKTADSQIREEAGIIRFQSVKIKELVQDMNLVSRLEYEMQPLHMESIRLSGLLCAYTVEKVLMHESLAKRKQYFFI